MPEPSYRYRARLDRIVDGDSVYLTVDLGFRASMSLAIRLAGIDALERGTTEGRHASDWLLYLIQDLPLTLVSEKGDKYGRWLGTIYTPDSPDSVNQRMIEAGHATPYNGGARA